MTLGRILVYRIIVSDPIPSLTTYDLIRASVPVRGSRFDDMGGAENEYGSGDADAKSDEGMSLAMPPGSPAAGAGEENDEPEPSTNPERRVTMSTSESVATHRAGERDANGERLMSWLRAQGGHPRCPLEVRRATADGQRGVHATADIPRGTEVVRVPHASLMTRELARTSPIGARIAAAPRRPRNAHTWLAAFLLEARRAPDSFFLPYFESLPASVPNLAVCLPRQKRLRAAPRLVACTEQIEQRRLELASEYRALCRAVPGFDSFSASEFIAARLLVGSRAFGVSIAGRRTEALVPFADLLNHHPTPGRPLSPTTTQAGRLR